MSEEVSGQTSEVVTQTPTSTKRSPWMNFGRGPSLSPLRVKKTLIDAKEKARIIKAIQADPSMKVMQFARKFKRLPATIRKFAAQVGVTLNE